MIEGQIAAGLKNYRFGTDKAWKKNAIWWTALSYFQISGPRWLNFIPMLAPN